jgi:molecular chaperone GrpE (heat shock protein)
MFNSNPVFAGVPAGAVNGGASEGTSVSQRLTAMLPGGRGRGFGRGSIAVGPANAPAAHGAPEPAHDQEPQSGGAGQLPPEFLDYIEVMGQNISYLRDQLAEVRTEVSAINSRGTDSHHVFDALHAELNDYKRDFIFQHVKPLLRPLLFLCDSLDGFDKEMALYEESQSTQVLPPDALKATKVRQNITFMRDQLIEALELCEIEPLPVPSGEFDAKTQKAIDTVPVSPEMDGTIVEVIRIGWNMSGHLMRPAEVILGKAK